MMKHIGVLLLAAILNLSCNAQGNKKEENLQNDKEGVAEMPEQPKGTWRVDKEFDENGNLIRYDSIYSWSSTDSLDQLAQNNPDSLIQSFQSKFYRNFSGIDKRFGDLFADDSLFTKHFFDDDFFNSEFGRDFMDIDRIRERMEARQQEFLERYRSEFWELEKEDSEGGNG